MNVKNHRREKLKDVAATCPGFQARALARALTRYFNVHFKQFNLTAVQFSQLVGIGQQEGATVIELASSAGVDPTTLSRNLVVLESRGFVLAQGGRGRLGKKLRLTRTGWKIIFNALPVWQEANDKLLTLVAAEDLRSTTKQMAFLAGVVVRS